MKTTYYTETAGVLVALGLSRGLSLRAIAETRLPRHHPIFSRWKREHEGFRELVELGELARTDPRARRRLDRRAEALSR